MQKLFGGSVSVAIFHCLQAMLVYLKKLPACMMQHSTKFSDVIKMNLWPNTDDTFSPYQMHRIKFDVSLSHYSGQLVLSLSLFFYSLLARFFC